jgi:hypothetical protein
MPEEVDVQDNSGPERLRALLLQTLLVGLVVVAGLLVLGAVADVTTELRDGMEAAEP